MINSPLISCIVRVFNGELYLAEALDSILAQTHRPLEVLVVDDGSTDGTAKLVGGYGEKVTSPGEIKPALKRAFDSGVPACINVMVDPTLMKRASYLG